MQPWTGPSSFLFSPDASRSWRTDPKQSSGMLLFPAAPPWPPPAPLRWPPASGRLMTTLTFTSSSSWSSTLSSPWRCSSVWAVMRIKRTPTKSSWTSGGHRCTNSTQAGQQRSFILKMRAAFKLQAFWGRGGIVWILARAKKLRGTDSQPRSWKKVSAVRYGETCLWFCQTCSLSPRPPVQQSNISGRRAVRRRPLPLIIWEEGGNLEDFGSKGGWNLLLWGPIRINNSGAFNMYMHHRGEGTP